MSLRVEQIRSEIGHSFRLRRVLKGLGLRGLGSSVTVADTPSFRGMVKKVLHLVRVEQASDKKKA